MSKLLVVGHSRSQRAIQMGVRWEDEALAAIPLFAGLRAAGLDPLADCRFVNWFERGGRAAVRRHKGHIAGLGKEVQEALAARRVAHVPLIHPAARGAIRLRERYIAHVVERLAQAGIGQGTGSKGNA